MNNIHTAELLAFLKPLTVKDNETYTHINLNTNTKYRVPDNLYRDFWYKLCAGVYAGETHSIAEVAGERSSIIIDVKLMYNKGKGGYTSAFVRAIVKTAQDLIAKHLGVKTVNNTHMLAFLLESNSCTNETDNGGGIGYNFRIVFSYCRVDTNFIRNIFFQEFLDIVQQDNLFRFLESQPSNQWSDIIDIKIYDKGVSMYGCRVKGNKGYQLTLSGVYQSLIGMDVTIEDSVSVATDVEFGESKNKDAMFFTDDNEFGFVDVMSWYDGIQNNIIQADFFNFKYIPPRVKRMTSNFDAINLNNNDDDTASTVSSHIMSEQNLDDMTEEERLLYDQDWKNDDTESDDESEVSSDAYKQQRFWLPVFFSTGFCKAVQVVKTPANPPAKPIRRVGLLRTDLMDDGRSIDTTRDSELERYFEIGRAISHQRMANEHAWLDVGKGLFECSDGSSIGLEHWMQLTANYGLNHELCEDHWYDFNEYGINGISRYTISYYAMIDDPETYGEWRNIEVERLLDNASSCADDDIARAFHERFPHEFLYDGNDWWFFSRHRWLEDVRNMKLNNYLAESFQKVIRQYIVQLNEINNNQTNATRDLLDTKSKNLSILINKLKSEPFKERIIKTLRRFYFKVEFNRIKDELPYLTVCKNGVIEVSLDRMSISFRPGKPEDFCTKSTNISLPSSNSVLPERYKLAYKKLKTYLEQLFLDPNNPGDTSYITWMALYRASLLFGKNDLKIFPMFLGARNSSKSQYENLMIMAMGDYAMKGFNSSISYNIRENAGGATPEVSRTQGARLIFYDELDSRTPLDAGKVRKQTGGDSAASRDLFHSSRQMMDITQQFKIAATMNKYVPWNDAAVDALWERVRLCLFITRYLEVAKLSNMSLTERRKKRIYLMDRSFDSSLKSLAPVALWMMFMDYPTYARDGLPYCQLIEDETLKYRASSDYYMNFIKSALKVNPDSLVTTSRMYAHFKAWYNRNFPNSKPPTEPQLQQELGNKNIIPIGKDYHGYELVTETMTVSIHTPTTEPEPEVGQNAVEPIQ